MLKKRCYVILTHVIFSANAYALSVPDQQKILQIHNKYRQSVKVPAISWSNKLAQSSQRYANQLAQRGCIMEHSGIKNIGENIYWASAETRTVTSSDGKVTKFSRPQNIHGQDVVEVWGNEKQHFDYASNSCLPNKLCGHYTQMIWRTTKQVGCAKSACSDGGQIWVCHYSPPGNYVGQKPY